MARLAELGKKLSSADNIRSKILLNSVCQIKMANKRDVCGILQVIRDLALKRKNVNTLRFRDEVSARSQPDPALPNGPHSKLSANYYYSRDARRILKPDEVLIEGTTKLKLEGGSAKPPETVMRVPGRVHLWDL